MLTTGFHTPGSVRRPPEICLLFLPFQPLSSATRTYQPHFLIAVSLLAIKIVPSSHPSIAQHSKRGSLQMDSPPLISSSLYFEHALTTSSIFIQICTLSGALRCFLQIQNWSWHISLAWKNYFSVSCNEDLIKRNALSFYLLKMYSFCLHF